MKHKNLRKKIFSIILSLVMVMPILNMGTTVNADDSTCGYGVYWSYDGGTGILNIAGSGRMFDYPSGGTPWNGVQSSISTVVVNNGVNYIGQNAFNNCTNLTSVSIGDSVISIGAYAFYNCKNLTNLRVPCTAILENNTVFKFVSNIQNVTVGAGVGTHAIPDYTSANYIYSPWGASSKSIISLTIENGVDYIGDYAFAKCANLRNLTLPISTKITSATDFEGCTNIISVAFTAGNGGIPNYENDDYTKTPWYASRSVLTSAQFCQGVNIVADGILTGCFRLADVAISKSVKAVNNNAFAGCSGIANVYYTGSAGQWNGIAFGYGNDFVKNAYKSFDRIEEHPKTDHVIDGGTITVYPTCYSAGVKTYNCCYCTYKFYDAYIAPTPHSNINVVTPATMSANGKILSVCQMCGGNQSQKTIYYPKNIDFYVDGRKTVVTDSKGKVVSPSNYTTKFTSNVSKGTASYTITIKFKGNYSGSKTYKYKIKPVVSSITKIKTYVKKGQTYCDFSWKKMSGVTGYQNQFSLKKRMQEPTNTNKYNFVTGASKSKAAIPTPAIKKKQNVYLRIRGYKKNGNTTCYFNWSNAKTYTKR